MKFIFLFFVVVNTCILPSSAAAYTASSISADLNGFPIIMSGKTIISYQHDPVSDGLYAFQRESIEASPGKEKFIYTCDVTTCQVIIMRDSVSGLTKLTHIDSTYTPESCAKLLEDFQAAILEKNSQEASAAVAISVPKVAIQIVINQTDLESAIGEAEFKLAYKCSIDERLESLSKAFSGCSIAPEIIRFTNITDISAPLQKYLEHDESYKGVSSELYKQLSIDATSGICVNIETGELSWWSIPLSRLYSAKPDKFTKYFEYKTTHSHNLSREIKKKTCYHHY